MENHLKLLEILTKTYIELNKVKAKEPGECSHMIAMSIHWVERQINKTTGIINGSYIGD